MKILEIFDRILPKVAPAVFIFLTFFYSLSRIPFFDEAYAYLISNLKTVEIFHLTRIEGHPFLWYFLLKAVNFSYPGPMLLLNWAICTGLIIFFWKKAPFNNLIKFLITFSYPFFHYFAVVARPYGLTVLAVFLLCFYYKDALKKPLLFSSLIVFCSNTTIIGVFGAFSFFCLFVYDIYKNFNQIGKKNLFKISAIFSSGALLFLFQFLNLKMPPMRPVALNFFAYSINPFRENIFQVIFYFSICILLFCSVFVLYKKAKKSLVFLLVAYGLMTVMFFKIYVGAIWHYYFYFVYLVAAFWLCWDKIKNDKKIICSFVFFLILALNPFSFFKNGYCEALNTKNYKFMSDKILKSEEYKNSKLFAFDWFSPFSPGLLPYFEKSGIKIYDINGFDRISLKSMELTPSYYNTPVVCDDFVSHIEKNKNNYLITQEYFFKQGVIAKNVEYIDAKMKKGGGFICVGENSKIFFELVESYPNIPFSIYKIKNE